MAMDGKLKIIGESINDSVPKTRQLFEAGDLEGIKELARSQDQGGAEWIDVNVGRRPPEFMAQTVRDVQSVTAKPLSFDSPDPAMIEAGLKAYDRGRAGAALPILNSISLMRTEMFKLHRICPFMPILLATERLVNGEGVPCHTVEETVATAWELIVAMRRAGFDIPNSQVIIDCGIAPIGSDTEGMTKRTIGSIRAVGADPRFKGVHMSLGLSNFTVMLPPKKGDGSPVKGPLESAFLTMTVPYGLDMVIGSVSRKYKMLPAGDPALTCLDDFLKLEGFDALARIQEYYA